MYKQVIRSFLFCTSCVVVAAAIAPTYTALCASAQTASTDLSFEVATIKPVIRDASHHFDPKHFWAHVYQTRASYWSMTLENLVTYAYNIQKFQVTGPDWANTDRFDIEATIPDGADRKDDRKMLQALLRDRFRLAFHTEKRELEGYALVVDKHGGKLKPSIPDLANHEAEAPLKQDGGNVGEKGSKSGTLNRDGSSTFDLGKRGTEKAKFDPESSSAHYEFSKMTMEELAAKLSGCLGSLGPKVEDQTGMKGDFQVAYDCPLGTPRSTTNESSPATLPSDPQGASPSLTASLNALGLKLERRKILLDVYIIDHVERPSEN